MPFSDLVGQDVAVDYLRRSVQSARLAHALLFTGPEGVGKRAAALSLAQALNCLTPKAGDACGECLACRKIAAGNHPDVSVIAPEGDYLKIEQIRERLQADAVLKPMEGRAKVYVLDPADALTLSAANSLLKILEEPPSAVTLVLVTAQPWSLLPTIRSRCQEVRFHAVAGEPLRAWLQERLQCPPDTARALAALSGGRPAEAVRLQEPEVQELRQRVLALAQGLGPEDWLAAARTLGEDLEVLPETLGLLLTWYRDLLILAVGGDAVLLTNSDRAAELRPALARETPESLLGKCRAVFAAQDQWNHNVNAQLVLEVLCMRLGQPGAAAA